MGVHTDNNCGCSETGGGTTPGTPGNEFAQNNVGTKLNGGIFTIAPTASNMYDIAVCEKLAVRFNSIPLTITEIETPVIVYVIIFVQGGLSSKKHKVFFTKGKGKWGLGGAPVVTTDFEIFETQNLLITDIVDGNAYTVTVDLGNLPDGDYLTAANGAERDFIDATKTYFITYNKDNKAYLLKFEGELGYYGGSYPDDFIMENFLPASDSDVEPEITKTSQLINDGDGLSPFATEADINGFNLVVNQASASLYLRNHEGTNIATVNLAFLNNEGTTFFYNEATEKLELKNDDGEVLSAVPVSAFVSNLMQSVEFNGAAPYLLEFKDATGNIVDTVTVNVNNVQGLQAALNNKVNKDGSNVTAMSNWNINVTSAGSANTWGDAYADLTSNGANLEYIVGLNGLNAKRYTASSVKLWLAIAMTDISGLTTAFANITTALSGKANDADVIHKTGDEKSMGLKSFRQIGFDFTDGSTIAKVGLDASGRYLQFTIPSGDVVFSVDTYGVKNSVFFGELTIPPGTAPTSAVNASQLNSKADNTDVLHKEGNETKVGDLTMFGALVSRAMGVQDQWRFETLADGSLTITNAYRTSTAAIRFNVNGSIDILNGKMTVAGTPAGNTDVVRLQDIANKADLVAGKVPVMQLPSLLLLGETAGSAGRGDHTKIAYDHTFIGGNPHVTAIADIPGLGVTLDALIAGQDYVKDYSYTGSSAWFNTLNANYPDAPRGFKVYAFYTGTDPVEISSVLCEKLNGEWAIYNNLHGIVAGA